MSSAEPNGDRLASLGSMRVMVTGAHGFIGGHLCRALAAGGAAVCAVSRRLPAEAGAVAEQVALDLCDLDALRRAFARVRPDLVFHLAGHVTGAPQLEHVIPCLQSNLLTAVNMMTCCAELGCRRLVMAASLEEPDIADGPPKFGSPYAASKWAAHAYGRMFFELYGLPVVQGRVFIVYGPGQAGSGKLIPYTIESLLAGEKPRFGSGARQVDWVYIDDVIRGLLTLAVAPGVEGMTVDIGSGSLVAVREVVKEIFQILDVPDEPLFGALAPRPQEIVRVANVARTASLLGWRAEIPLHEGLQRTAEWHRRIHASTPGGRPNEMPRRSGDAS